MGKPALVAPNPLQRQFKQHEPNHAWITDITNIQTHEGRLYLAAVVDLHSRIQTNSVLDALTMTVWRRRPKESVIIHSYQGSQGEVNRSSPHQVTRLISCSHSATLAESSNPRSCVVSFSMSLPRLGFLARSG